MAQDFTTTGLLASVKRRGMLPTTSSGQALDVVDYLAFGTEELQTYVLDLLLSANQEYAVTDSDIAIVASTDTYAVPQRASDEALRQVLLNDGLGTLNVNYYPITQVSPANSYDSVSGSPARGYYYKDGSIVLVPSPTASSTLRLQYFRRPSALVATSAVATISSINLARTVITTTATVPATFTSGITTDIVSHVPGFRIQSMDQVTSGTVSGTTITYTNALPASVVAGNYVALAGESPVPQVMVEAHPLLAQRIVVKALEALGDKKVDAASAVCDRMRKELLARLMPRTKGTVQYVVNPNGPGLRGRLGRRRF